MANYRNRPTIQLPDGTVASGDNRISVYKEAYTYPIHTKMHGVADEGSYFVVQTTTPGTGIAGHAAPIQSDLATKPLVHIYNSGLLRLYIDYIKVRMTAIGANATTTDFEVWLDPAGATTFSSGGSLVSPGLNCNSDNNLSTGAVVRFGAVVAVSVNARRVGHSRVRSVVPVVEDQYTFTFGQPVQTPNAATTTAGTGVICAVVPFGPMVVGPAHNFQFSEWGAAQSGAHSFDMEVGYWER